MTAVLRLLDVVDAILRRRLARAVYGVATTAAAARVVTLLDAAARLRAIARQRRA